MEQLNEMAHYNALLDEATSERLAHQAASRGGAGKSAWCRAMSSLGSLLYELGKQLQERYGYA
jgi:hypothetical protein